jgi:hypothetical protein
MAARVLDIVGQPCDACDRKGVAKVVHFVQPSGKHRFFYGCSASAKDTKCAGSKAWQSIEVPEELKQKVLRDKGVTKVHDKGKKKKTRMVSEQSDSSDYEELEEVTTTKTETSTTRTTKKVRRIRKDADHWTKAQDDDYAE